MNSITPDLIKKLATYHPSQEAVDIVRSYPLLFIAGVSGAGKNTVMQRLITTGDYHVIVSHTTRSPRSNDGVMERDGADYYFVTPDVVERMVDEHEFVEAKYTHGKIYGTSVGEFKRAAYEHRTAVSDIDIKGIEEYLAIKPDTVAVFLVPPSVEAWMNRLKKRYGDEWEAHRDELNVRMETAQSELAHLINSEQYHLVINDSLDETVGLINRLVRGEVVVSPHDEKARKIATELLKAAHIGSFGLK